MDDKIRALYFIERADSDATALSLHQRILDDTDENLKEAALVTN